MRLLRDRNLAKGLLKIGRYKKMKRNYFLILFVLLILLFTSCGKKRAFYEPLNEEKIIISDEAVVEATIIFLMRTDECPEFVNPTDVGPSECPLTDKPPIPKDSAIIRIDKIIEYNRSQNSKSPFLSEGQEFKALFSYSSRLAKIRYSLLQSVGVEKSNNTQEQKDSATPKYQTEKEYIPQEYVAGEGRYYIYTVGSNIEKDEVKLLGVQEGNKIRVEINLYDAFATIGIYNRIPSPNDLNIAIENIILPEVIKVNTPTTFTAQFRNVGPKSCCEFKSRLNTIRSGGSSGPSQYLQVEYVCNKEVQGFAPGEIRNFPYKVKFAIPDFYSLNISGQCLVEKEFDITDNSKTTQIEVVS